MSSMLQAAMRDCVRELCESMTRSPPSEGYVIERSRWQKGNDGHYRPSKRRVVYPRDLRKRPSFERCVGLAKSDPVIGAQIDKLVGTPQSKSLVELDRFVTVLVSAMISDDGRLEFKEDRFENEWSKIERELTSDKYTQVTIAPFPSLVAPFPVKLSSNLVLDKLDGDEIGACAIGGLLRSRWEEFPLIEGERAVGVRFTWATEKVVGEDEPQPTFEPSTFGYRNPSDQMTIVDDILALLRLFKGGHVKCPGEVVTAPLGIGWSYRFRSMRAREHLEYTLQESEVGQLQELWSTLVSGVLEKRSSVAASLRRFNMAFDRDDLEDRIVDLMIAAESLFLEGGARERGEQRFRLALRASKFVRSTSYQPRQIYDLMRNAYTVRSEVVHGGKITKARLPDKKSASLAEFISAVEEVMRLAIRQALTAQCMDRQDFWDGLLFDR